MTITVLASAGITIRIACGRMTSRCAVQNGMAMASIVSNCPFGTARKTAANDFGEIAGGEQQYNQRADEFVRDQRIRQEQREHDRRTNRMVNKGSPRTDSMNTTQIALKAGIFERRPNASSTPPENPARWRPRSAISVTASPTARKVRSLNPARHP